MVALAPDSQMGSCLLGAAQLLFLRLVLCGNTGFREKSKYIGLELQLLLGHKVVIKRHGGGIHGVRRVGLVARGLHIARFSR